MVLPADQYSEASAGLAALSDDHLDRTFLRLRIMPSTDIARIIVSVEQAELSHPDVIKVTRERKDKKGEKIKKGKEKIKKVKEWGIRVGGESN